MGYRQLYEQCQQIHPAVSRRVVYPLVLAQTGLNQIRHIQTTLDTAVCRGLYLSARNEEAKLVQQVGTTVIVTARGMNYCWTRFVFVKELMHAFDDPKAAADNGDAFDTQLQDLSGPATTLSPQGEAEYLSFWMALGILCPEPIRLGMQERLAAKQTDHYAIALELRIPELYVPLLFEARYKTLIEGLVGEAVRLAYFESASGLFAQYRRREQIPKPLCCFRAARNSW